jgi:hypothetical protein
VIGCSGFPDPKKDKPNAPDTNDPAFAIRGMKNWYLIGDGARTGDDRITIIVTPPPGSDFVDAYIGDLPVVRMDEQADGFSLDQSITKVPAGAYDILFSANGSNTAFAKVSWNRSAAYYVLVSTDYDFSDPGAIAIMDMNFMHTNHPDLRITHFWAPYTYTDPNVTDDRRTELSTWVKTQRDMFHDEIGLHIHPYCNFVDDAGMTCITDQSTTADSGIDVSGYTIKLAAYGRDGLGTLLQHAFDIFAAHDLGKPQTFRAGGWTADLDSLLALSDKGFVADTSALNWARIEEWQGKELYSWNMTHWAPINDTSQPYYPSQTDVLMSTPGSNMAMLEVPDNGVMIDYVSSDEMTTIFNENWDGTPLASPRTLMMGFHPSEGFAPDEYMRVNDFLKLADMHLASKDLGPVVYTTLSDVTPVFPAQ